MRRAKTKVWSKQSPHFPWQYTICWRCGSSDLTNQAISVCTHIHRGKITHIKPGFSLHLHKSDLGEKRACLILESVDHSLTTSGALTTNPMDQSARAERVYRRQTRRSAGRRRSSSSSA